MTENAAVNRPVVTFAVPCYNSADYMEHCVDTLLPLGKDIEVLLVDDGSTKDDTPQIADRLEAEHPGIVRAIHQPNKGHGGAVNTGLENARGVYFKVVDSDDWISDRAMEPVMAYLRQQAASSNPTDLVISNYVYEKVHENVSTTIRYTNVFPTDREFEWDDVRHFRASQYLLMHSVVYRTALVRDEVGLRLPEHCFYVDNVFVYCPLPQVKTMRYFDEDVYRYFIGREDQSVNESVMLSRIDQQVRVTKFMIDSVDLDRVGSERLRSYMRNYLSMMMCICSVFLRMDPTPEHEAMRKDVWRYLQAKDPKLYRRLRMTVLNGGTNLPTEAGRRLGLGAYHIAQKLFNFN